MLRYAKGPDSVQLVVDIVIDFAAEKGKDRFGVSKGAGVETSEPSDKIGHVTVEVHEGSRDFANTQGIDGLLWGNVHTSGYTEVVKIDILVFLVKVEEGLVLREGCSEICPKGSIVDREKTSGKPRENQWQTTVAGHDEG